MSDKTTFDVSVRPVRIRAQPTLRGEFIRWMQVGEQVHAEADSRTEADGYVWWKHDEGWTAERSIDGIEIYLTQPQSIGVDKKTFKVVMQVRVRTAATLQGEHIRWIDPGTIVEVDANSRTVNDGYVWWKHSGGWSAENSTNGVLTFMTPTQVAAEPQKLDAQPMTQETKNTETTTTQDVEQAEEKVATTPQPTTRKFKVGLIQVRIRQGPSLSAEHVDWLNPGTILDVETDSRTEADGYVWWKHSYGWSAERNIAGTAVYLVHPDTMVEDPSKSVTPLNTDGDLNTQGLPFLDTLFKKVPFALNRISWFQYYGNNRFAHKIWSQGTRWYSYTQALHGGLDFGVWSHTGTVPVYAGVEGGTFIKRITDYFAPHAIFVKVDDYTIIYGHINIPQNFSPNQPIGVDTHIGDITFGGPNSTNHLHLEVRYKDTWAVNPLLFMSPEVRGTIMSRYKPYSEYFYSDANWNQWVTPLDQPTITLGGKIRGPHAR